MDLVGLLAGTGWASGVNLYAAVLLLGLLGRTGLADTPALLERPDVLLVAALLYTAEFVADKVPWVDSVWDAVHTVVRPVGGAALGAVLAGEAGTFSEVGAALAAGSVALASHAIKATTRAAINTSPEPVSNLLVSLGEDGLVAGVVVLAVTYPLLALGAVVLLLVGGGVTAVLLLRVLRAAWRRRRERRRATS